MQCLHSAGKATKVFVLSLLEGLAMTEATIDQSFRTTRDRVSPPKI